MPTYLYETMPAEGEAPERFEYKQSMKEAALTHHPETGVPVRRVLVGGFAPMGLKSSAPEPPPMACGVPRSHPGGCACCH